MRGDNWTVEAGAAEVFWGLGLEMQSPVEIPAGILFPEFSRNTFESLLAAAEFAVGRLLTQ